MEHPTDLTTEVPEAGFRLQAKKFLLTYKTHIDKGELAHFVDVKMKCTCEVKICHETSEDGYEHTHCAVKCPKKPNITDCRRFDWGEGDDVIHPNIRLPRDAAHWRAIVKYLDKQDDAVYGELPIEYSSEEKFQEAVEYVKSCETWNQVMDAPLNILQTVSSKLAFFQQFHQFKGKGRSYKSDYSLETFKLPAQDLSTAVLLTGISNAGKTEYALAHFSNPLLVRAKDDLLELKTSHDGIVFDDMCFRQWPVEAIIHLLDMSKHTSIQCRYRNVRIPQGMPRVFTHNDFPFPEAYGDQRLAVTRRLRVVRISEPTY